MLQPAFEASVGLYLDANHMASAMQGTTLLGVIRIAFNFSEANNKEDVGIVAVKGRRSICQERSDEARSR